MTSNVASTEYDVQLGVWTNWSRGPVLGATLTLARFEANLLISFISFFVGMVGTRFWRIASLAFHRYYSRPGLQDALYHQRQAVLRNSQTAEGGFISLVQLIWAWRKISERAFLRALPPLVFALCK
jgi:hypothetical protein